MSGTTFNAVVAASIQDSPRDGQGDSFFTTFDNLVSQSSTLERRAIIEFDVGSTTPVDLAVLDFRLAVNSQGTPLRTFEILVYSGNGAADLSDFSAAATKVHTVSFFGSQGGDDFRLDVTDAVNAVLAGGSAFVGIRVDAVNDVSPTHFIDDSFVPAMLTLNGAPPMRGSRGWESVPNAIRMDGIETFRVEVDVGGAVEAVTLDPFSLFLVAPPDPDGDGRIVLRDDGLDGDRAAGDFIYTSAEFRYDTSKTYLWSNYEGDANSPEGLHVEDVGDVFIQDLDGIESRFLLRPAVGLLRADIPDVSITSISPEIAVSDHLINIRSDAQATQRTLRGPGDILPRITQPIYQQLPDQFDFFMFFSTNKVEQLPSHATSSNFNAGKHIAARIDYTGIGRAPFDATANYGSDGRLLGMSLLDAYDRGIWGSNATHELVHQWSAFADSSRSLGINVDSAHYLFASSAGSLVGGNVWIDNGDGTFTVDFNQGRSGAFHAPPIDLYMMGLIDASEVPPIRVHDNSVNFSNPTVTPDQIVRTVTIDDIIARHGVRTPGPTDAQRDFRIGFVAESYNRALTATEMTFYEILAAHYTAPIPAGSPDPYIGNGWQSISRYFGHGTTWSSLLPGGALAGTKFEDVDGDGVRDAGEPGLAGVVIYLDLNDDGRLEQDGAINPEPVAITDANGDYVFTDLPVGNYVIRELVPPGYRQSAPTGSQRLFAVQDSPGTVAINDIIEIDPLTGAERNRFAAPGGSTGNTAGLAFDGRTLFFVDADDNTLYELDPDNGAIRDSIDLVAVTGTNDRWDGLAVIGGEVFVNAPGLKRIFVIDPASDTLVRTINMSSNPNFSPFGGLGEIEGPGGSQALVGSIGLSNGIGLLDPQDGSVIDTFTHQAVSGGGDLGAAGLAGEIYIGFSDAAGTVQVFDAEGAFQRSFGTSFSIAALAGGGDGAHRVTLAVGQSIDGLDFGNEPVAGELQGVTFIDADADGVRDPLEEPRPGVTVYLDPNNNGTLDPGERFTVTDANGAYAFRAVVAGEHIVREIRPLGNVQTGPAFTHSYYAYVYGANGMQPALIDPDTGEVRRLGTQSDVFLERMHGLVRTNDGQFFGVNGQDTNDTFFAVDLVTNDVTPIGPVRVGGNPAHLAFGLAYNPATDTIYGLVSNGGTLKLATFDRTTGAATVIGPGSTELTATSGIAFDTDRNVLVAFDTADDQFWEFDLAGNPTLLWDTENLNGLGFAWNGEEFVLHAINFDNGDPVLSNRLMWRIDPYQQRIDTEFFVTDAPVPMESLDYFRVNGGHLVYVAEREVVTDLDFGNYFGFVITETSDTTEVSENSDPGLPHRETDTFTVVLTGPPDPGTVVILNVGSSDAGEAVVSPAQLTFNDSNWDQPRTVTVSGINDNLADGDQAVTVTVSVNDTLTTDNDFDPLANQTVTVTVLNVPVAPTMLGPLNGQTVTGGQVAFTWTEVTGATSYNLWLIDRNAPQIVKYSNFAVPAGSGSFQLASGDALPVGDYRYWFSANNANGFSNWSGPHDFSVGAPATVPGAPSGFSTSGGAARPTIHWDAVAGATFYNIWLINLDTGALVESANRLATNSFTPSADLAAARHRIWVRSGNAMGTSPWSAPFDFNGSAPVGPPAAPTTFSKTDTADPQRPRINWNAVTGAASYRIWLINLETGALVAGQSGLSTNSFTPSFDLADAKHRIWVQATNAAGTSPWSAPFDFTVSGTLTAPARPAWLSVTNQNSPRPTIEWEAPAGATSYAIWFLKLAPEQVISNAAGLAIAAFTPDIDLADGDYRFYVRAINSVGSSGWVGPLDFNVHASGAAPLMALSGADTSGEPSADSGRSAHGSSSSAQRGPTAQPGTATGAPPGIGELTGGPQGNAITRVTLHMANAAAVQVASASSSNSNLEPHPARVHKLPSAFAMIDEELDVALTDEIFAADSWLDSLASL